MGNLQGADKKARKYMSEHGSKSKRGSLRRSKPHILVTKTTAITNDYDLLTKKEIGQGISGKVILCRDRLTRKKYALKKVKDSRNARREIEIQWRASQNFEHIVRIVDVYENKIRNDSFFFIIMEL
jgi:serine/threonine protein kinase